MTDYRIFETERFQADIRNIARRGHDTVTEKLRMFVYPQPHRRPHFGSHIRKLRNWEPATWRYRVGAWRFFYEVDEDNGIVFMTGAEHRSSAYRTRSEEEGRG